RTQRLGDLSFLHALDEAYPTWWTSLPLHAPLLTGWAGGLPARRLAGNSPQELASAALANLSRVLKIPRRRLDGLLESFHVHDWQRDRFSRGAYSYVPVGALAARRTLARPIEQTHIVAGGKVHRK